MNQRTHYTTLIVTLALSCTAAHAEVAAEWKLLAARHGASSQVEAAIARLSTPSNGGNGAGTASSERRDAVIAVAAFAILEKLAPASREEFASRLAISFSRIPETDAKAEGSALGRRVAEETMR